MLWTKANQLIEIVDDSVTKERSDLNNSYHNIKYEWMNERFYWYKNQLVHKG